MKNTLCGIDVVLDIAKENISELEDSNKHYPKQNTQRKKE